MIADVRGWSHLQYLRRAIQDANGLLIAAAAPDLLEALKALMPESARYANDEDIIQARAAIAKATGARSMNLEIAVRQFLKLWNATRGV